MRVRGLHLSIISTLVACLALTQTLGCASSQDVMSRAQQEIDTRRYAQAVERLESLGQDEPEIRTSNEYVDLITSAYLGRAGVDFISTLGNWAESYKSLEDAHKGSQNANADPRSPESFQEYKKLISRLTPPEFKLDGLEALTPAIQLCNERLHAYVSGKPDSKRVLVKTIFVNFWAILGEIEEKIIPGSEKLLSSKDPREACEGFKAARASFLRTAEFALNIQTAGELLGDHKSAKLESVVKLTELTRSLGWLNDYSTCEQILPLSHEVLDRIVRTFAR